MDHAETLFDAISVIIDQKLNDMDYNKTIKAIIIDDSQSNSGIYKVKENNLIYDAYSNNTQYTKDTLVYILTDNNSQYQKIIIGKAYSETDDYTLSTPLDSFIAVYPNLIDNSEDIKGGLIANHINNDKQEVLLWSEDYTQNPIDSCTEFVVQGKFKTWLDQYDLIAGDYGLKVEIETQNNKGEFNFHDLTLSAFDMIGNAYQFVEYQEQTKIFRIENLDKIIAISLYFYQEGGSFIESTQKSIPYQLNGIDLFNNIFVKDIVLKAGYNKSDIEENKENVKINTEDSTDYGDNAFTAIKKIKLN